MRKIAIMLLVATTLVTLNSCKKNTTETANKPEPTNQKLSLMTGSTTINVAALHDMVVAETYRIYGRDTVIIKTRSGLITLFNRMEPIIDSIVGFDLFPNDSFSEIVIQNMDELEMFNTDNTVKSRYYVRSALIGLEANSVFKQALFNIDSYSGETLISYAKNEMDNLNLSVEDEQRAAIFIDVLESSHNWNAIFGEGLSMPMGYVSGSNWINDVSRADAIGAHVGFLVGMRLSGSYQIAGLYAMSIGAAYSMAAAH
jgi:hypothetical protein